MTMSDADITWRLCEAVNSGRSPSMDEIADAIAEVRALRYDFAQEKAAHKLTEEAAAAWAAENERLKAAGVGYSQQTVDAITKEREALRARVAELRVQLEAAECLQDSAYLDGAKAGWNAAQSDNPHKAMAELRKSRAGYLKALRLARQQPPLPPGGEG